MKFKLILPIIIAIIIIGLGIWLIFGINNEQPISTEDWKTYTDQEYGYSFKYPQDWNVIQCLGTVLIAPQEAADNILESNCIVKPNKLYVWGLNYRTEQQFIDVIEPYRVSDSYKDVAKEDITINGIEATKYTTDFKRITDQANPGDRFIDVLFPVEGGYIESTFMDQEYFDIYEQILNTFTL